MPAHGSPSPVRRPSVTARCCTSAAIPRRRPSEPQSELADCCPGTSEWPSKGCHRSAEEGSIDPGPPPAPPPCLPPAHPCTTPCDDHPPYTPLGVVQGKQPAPSLRVGGQAPAKD